MPDDTYHYETDTDGFDAPIHLALTITVDGDHAVADYAGTSPQVKQAINVVYNYTEAYTTFGLKVALAPDVPNNEGSFRAVTVRAPEGSVLNCLHPAPTAARHLLGHFLAGMVLATLSPVLPDRAMAEGMAGLWSTNVHGNGPDGNRFTLLSFLSGGTGARRGLDGLNSTAFPSGVSGIPTEVFENRSPLVVRSASSAATAAVRAATGAGWASHRVLGAAVERAVSAVPVHGPGAASRRPGWKEACRVRRASSTWPTARR